MNIAVLMTCFNRKEKTVLCLEKLIEAKELHNECNETVINLSLFLTDDGCTDHTSDAVRKVWSNQNLSIIEGNGSCYWAGGMRMAWNEAMKQKEKWDFYLLLNDDTTVCPNVFDELLLTHNYALSTFGKGGIYSGITCSNNDRSRITYGGDVFDTAARGTWHRVGVSDTPQLVDMINANILLVDASVVEKVGIFPDVYVHGCADTDYCMMVRRNCLPALVTANICGMCDDDHLTKEEEILMLMKMTYKERCRYVSNPIHSDADYLTMIKRNIPQKYPVSWLLRKMRICFPALYYRINKIRGLYGTSKQVNE